VPGAALAAQPDSGKWVGGLSTNGAKVTFGVSRGGGSVENFAVVLLPIYCYGQGFSHKVFIVPSARIKNSGKFSRVFKSRNDDGQVDGTLEVSGRFKTSKRAGGKLSYVGGGCSSGPINWTAHAKN
jgi:hypothetical protein